MRVLSTLLFIGGSGLSLLGCDESSPPAKKAHESASLPQVAVKRAREPSPASSEPETLLNDLSSAYAAGLLPREDELLVTTSTHFFRVTATKQVEKVRAQLGDVQTLYEDSIVFFRDGKIRALSLEDREERVIVAVEHYVQYLLSSGRRLAWLSHEREGRYFIQAESAGSVKTLYTSMNQVMWPVLHDETVYFLERSNDVWKVGRAPLNGSGVAFGKEHRGRVPPMLAIGPDGLYFYDGPKLGVRKLTFDLEAEHPIAEGTICSPLAVSSRVVCAQVGGVIDIPHPTAKPRIVAQEASGPIANIAATQNKVFWIVDRGRDRMTVRTAPLPDIH